MTSTVGMTRATIVIARVLHGQLRSTARLVGLSLLGVLSLAISWSVARSADGSAAERLDDAAGLITQFTFSLVLPVVALIFGAGALGDARDDGTLVYLWLRPLRRGAISLGAWLAVVSLALPLTVIPTVLSALLLDVGGDLVVAAALASTLAVLAYAAVFVLLGALTRFSVVLGLIYVFLWEGLVASLGNIGAKMALRGYANSIVTARTGVRTDLADSAQSTSVIVFVTVVVVALVLTAVRLQRLEVD